MTRIEIQAKIDVFRRELKHLESIKICCNTCEHFAHAPVCSKYQSPVPKEVQSVGCDDFVYDQIPF